MSQIVTWLITLVVARILNPDDFGLMAMAMVYIGLVLTLSEFGLGMSVVILRDLKTNQVAQVNDRMSAERLSERISNLHQS